MVTKAKTVQKLAGASASSAPPKKHHSSTSYRIVWEQQMVSLSSF
jgi:hypothetical protein